MNRYKVCTSIDSFINFVNINNVNKKNIKIYNIDIDNDKIIFFTNSIDNLSEDFIFLDTYKYTFKKILSNYLITIIGLLIFIVLFFILNNAIIKIDIKNDNKKMDNSEIYNYINKNIKYYGKLGFLNTSINDLNKRLRKEFYKYEWINIEKKGVYLIVNLSFVKSDYTEENINNNDYIYSKYDAVIKGYYVKRGKILVSNNMTVKAGDALISSYVPLYNNEIKKVNPSGYVIGEVNYYDKIVIDKKIANVVRNGNMYKERKFILFDKDINHNCIYTNYDIEINEIYKLNKIIRICDIYYYEKINYERVYNINDAIVYGKSIIENKFLSIKKYNFEKILSIEVLNYYENNNKITINYLVNMIKDITY